MHNYPKFFKIVLMMVCLCFLCPALSFAAETGKNMIEPFMAAPFGSTNRQIVEAEGSPDEKKMLFYEKTVMDIPMRVGYSLFQRNDAGEPVVIEVTVSFTKVDLDFADAQQACAGIIGLVEAQMCNSEIINRQHKRAAFAESLASDVYITKAYLKDENIHAILVFWYDEDTKSLKASMRFGDKVSNLNEILRIIFDPSQSAETFLENETKPAFIKFNWNMSRRGFKRFMGQTANSYHDWPSFVSDRYQDSVFGIPAEVSAGFERENFFRFYQLTMVAADFYMSCPSQDKAEAVAKKIIELVASSTSVVRGIGFERVMLEPFESSSILDNCNWNALVVLEDGHVRISVKWFEFYEALNVHMWFFEGAVSDDYNKGFFEDIHQEGRRIFYRLNVD